MITPPRALVNFNDAVGGEPHQGNAPRRGLAVHDSAPRWSPVG